jgi:PadR family transcriptional regulator, regulatory protein PadR
MVRSRRPSAQTTAILLALAEEPTAWWYGYDLCRQLDIKPGSLYPTLVRLADRGLLETAWETDTPPGSGSQRQRLERSIGRSVP